jgi:phage tail-like protein
MLQEDPFLQRFTAGLDEVLTPLAVTLDCLDRYVDPTVAPEDFLGWLAAWVGLELDPRWSVEVRRSLLQSVAEVQDTRGTAAGLRDEIALLTGCDVVVCDPGGVAVSARPGGALPTGRSTGTTVDVVVRVLDAPADLRDPTSEARSRLHRAVRATVPAHLSVTVEVPT